MKSMHKQLTKTISMCLALSLALGTFSFSAPDVSARGTPRGEERDRPYVEGEVLVKYKKDRINLKTPYGRMASAFHSISRAAVKKNDIEEGNIAVLEIKDGVSVEQKIRELAYDPNIEFVQPNFRYYPREIQTNDSDHALLWGLDNTGQTINGKTGTPDADIDSPESWALNEGTNGSAIVAVIDTGVAYTHSDLVENMWDGANCKDENGNTLGGCFHGYDFGDNDHDPFPSVSSHGTHIAGTIAAVKNNSIGTIGVAPHATVMAIKTAFTSDSLVRSIQFAKHNNADVVNASWGGGAASCTAAFDKALYDAIDAFDGLFIAAAGNFGEEHNGTTYVDMPSDYGHATACWDGIDRVVSVVATDPVDALAGFSDFGKNYTDIGAPGVDIYSTIIPATSVSIDDTVIITEAFEGVTPPSAPSGWSANETWGTKTLESGTVIGTALFGDVHNTPYTKSTNATITSPTIDMSGAGVAELTFFSRCDTEYDAETFLYTDYMSLEASANGTTFTVIKKWDEIDLDNDSDAFGSAEKSLVVSLSPSYLTSAFQFRFRWITNGNDDTGSSGEGCFIDDLKLTTQKEGIEDRYEFMSGTSMAAPHVAGLAALLKGYKPHLTVAQIKNIIFSTGDTLPALEGKTVTGKRINAHQALQSLTPAITSFVVPSLSVTGAINQANRTIAITVSADADISALVPTIGFTGVTVNPQSGVAQDFTESVVYTVTATDGSTQTYTVVVMAVTAAPTLTVSRDASTPAAYQAAAGAAPEQGALVVKLTASEAEDILVDDVTFSTTADEHDVAVASATLWRADEEAGPWTAVDSTAVFNGNGSGVGFFRWQLGGDDRVNVPKSSAIFLKLVPMYASAQQAAVSGLQPRFALTTAHAVGAASSSEVSPDISNSIGEPITILNTTLSIALSPSSPAGSTAGGVTKEVFRFTGITQGGNTTLTRIDLTAEKGFATIRNVTLFPQEFDGSMNHATFCVPLSETRWRCTMNTSDGVNQIFEDTPRIFIVRADLGYDTSASAPAYVQFSLKTLGAGDTPDDTNDVLWSDGTTQQDWVSQPQSALTGGVLIYDGGPEPGTFDGVRPTIASLVLTDNDAQNKLSAGDTVTLTFDEMIDPSDIAPGLIPGGSAIIISDGATGDVSLAKTTGVLTITNIASVDIDEGETPIETTYTTKAALDSTGLILTITLTARNSGNGILFGNKKPGGIFAQATHVSDVNANLLTLSEVNASAVPHATAKKILTFALTQPAAIGAINQQNHTIALTVPFGTDVVALTPTVGILGASVAPSLVVAQDFTQPVTYVVTALDGTTQSYIATVTVAANTAKDITAFSIIASGKEFQGVIDQEQRAVSVIVSHDVDLAVLTSIITTTGVSVSPGSGVAQNFSQPVTYVVTAQDGSTKQYTVTVTKADKPAITSFTVISFGLSGKTIQGVIDESAHTVTIVFPFGSDISNLMTVIAFTGVSVDPAPGITPFFLSKIYTVTAQDRSTQSYAVFMSVAKNPAKQITAFAFTDETITVAIHENTKKIIAVAPMGTSVSSLTPTLTIAGASISPASGATQDFTQPVTYTVTAQDGSTQAYTVIVKALSSSQVLPGEGGAASITKEKPQVVVTSPDVPITVSVDAAAEDPAVDFGALIKNGEGTVPKTTINMTASVVEIPAETTVTSTDTAWNGVLSAPKAVAHIEIPKKDGHQRSVNTAVEVGQSGAKLSFDKAVRLVMIGHAGKKAGVISEGKSFAEITTQCTADSQTAGDALAQDTECAISAGSELVIWTKHFTTFVVFTETQNQPSGGGGGSSGGGGGGSSVAPQAPRPAPPTGGFRVIINNGDAMTSNTTVELSLGAGADTSFMLVSNNNNFDNVEKEPYTPKKIWIMADSIGTQTVYVKFLHADGSASPVVSDSILYLTVRTREPSPVEQLAPIIRPFKPLQVIAAPQRVLGTKVRREPAALAQRLSGRILLQTQEHGEAWYMYPDDKRRYYLGRPHDAFTIMRALGLGAKHDLIARTLHYPERLWGKILLDVEMNGEAYYINPLDARAYYLGRPADAFRIMRELGLGITNENLTQIEVGTSK